MSSERPRIAVLGSGANGASIGADLTRAGHDVTLIEQWPAHVEAMRANGVRIEMQDETFTQPVTVFHLCEVATFTEKFDIVFLLMKAYDTRWATHLIEPHLADDGIVVGVQNGMTADIIADVVGPKRAMGCVIEISSTMFDPGVVQRDSPPARSWFAVGALDDASKDREAEVAALLGESGTVETVENIRAMKWMKLVSNATTLVTTAIVGLPMLEAVELPGMRELMLRSGQEALDVGAALGYPVLPIFGLKADDLTVSAEIVETLLDTLLAGFVRSSTKTTVLQDWIKGRHSEVDDLNGTVVAEARTVGLDAPVNSAVVELGRRIERGELTPGPHNVDLLREIAGLPAAVKEAS
jgi:2-dehydropantoate 2-reductase